MKPKSKPKIDKKLLKSFETALVQGIKHGLSNPTDYEKDQAEWALIADKVGRIGGKPLPLPELNPDGTFKRAGQKKPVKEALLRTDDLVGDDES